MSNTTRNYIKDPRGGPRATNIGLDCLSIHWKSFLTLVSVLLLLLAQFKAFTMPLSNALPDGVEEVDIIIAGGESVATDSPANNLNHQTVETWILILVQVVARAVSWLGGSRLLTRACPSW